MKKYFVVAVISVVMSAVFLSQLASARPYAYFSDVTDTHYNVMAINWLAANGVVQGYSDGTFRPDSQINRAEFLKMLYETIGMVGYDSTELRFIDVPSSEWYVTYVKEAFATGVVNGYPDGTFRPANYINFVEAVKIVMNGFFDVDALYGDGEEYLPCAENLTDYDSIDTNGWYWKYLHVADELCILDFNHAGNYGTGYSPSANISRADMAEMLYRAKTLKDNEELTVYNDSYEPAAIGEEPEDTMMGDDEEEGGDDVVIDDEPFSLASSAFDNNGTIQVQYTCDGSDVSPPLSIAGVPSGAESLALILDDPDAPSGSWIHWLVWNIPPTATGFPEDGLPTSAVAGTTSFGEVGYGGPCPPLEDLKHRYYFKLYALDTDLTLDSSSTKGDLEMAMEGHILETVELMGKYGYN